MYKLLKTKTDVNAMMDIDTVMFGGWVPFQSGLVSVVLWFHQLFSQSLLIRIFLNALLIVMILAKCGANTKCARTNLHQQNDQLFRCLQ